jgi:hypothetical protein
VALGRVQPSGDGTGAVEGRLGQTSRHRADLSVLVVNVDTYDVRIRLDWRGAK